MTLRRKLILAFLAVTILPFLALLLGPTVALLLGKPGPAIRKAEELVGGRLQDNVEQAARAIDQFMIGCIRDMKAFSSDESHFAGDTTGVGQYMNQLTYFYPYFREFSFSNTQGTILASSDEQIIGKSFYDLYPPAAGEHFQSAIAQPPGPVFIARRMEPSGAGEDVEEMQVQFLTAIFNQRGECMGVVSGHIVTQHLQDLLSDIDQRIPGDKRSTLLDRKGQAIMTNAPAEAALAAETASSTDLPFSEIQEEGNGSGYITYTTSSGEKVMSGYANLWTYGQNQAGQWSLVASAPYDLIMEPVREAMIKAFLILVGATVIASLVGYWLATTLAKPVLRLTEGARKIAGGDLSARVSVTTHDETGELANSFNQMAEIIQDQIVALRYLNEDLEQRVEERTNELAKINADLSEEVTYRKAAQQLLEAAQSQLADTSRQAGMAEVATSVLHNVGNVLNSVNVTTTLVTDRIEKSKVTNIAKVAALLEDHKDDLGTFITTDSRGKQLPAYLATLATHLQQEQVLLQEELNSLQKNVEHIKDIVSMQQSYAKVYGVTEQLTPMELVEDALHLNAGALVRHEVDVIREYGDVPAIAVERHKVLQILVNLIRNAKYACDDSGRSEKWIRLRITQEDGEVVIAVIDNGIGIPAENMERIFAHGFTTRDLGHGFGLHNSALVAKELGGSLTAHSDGPDKGASFILRIPLTHPSLEP